MAMKGYSGEFKADAVALVRVHARGDLQGDRKRRG